MNFSKMTQLPINANAAEEEIKMLITEKGLNMITSKMIRKHLEAKFNCQLEDFKKDIDKYIEECIYKMNLINTDGPVKQSSIKIVENNAGLEADTSESDDDQLLDHKPSTSSANKKRKIMVSQNNLSDTEVEDMASAVKRRRSAVKPSAKKREQKAKDTKGKGGRKKNSVFSKICVLSSDLASLVGKDYMRRADVVKAMWAYFKSNNLMDPKNKQFVLLDEPLKKIFGQKKKIKAFGMMSALTKHVKDVAHLDEAARIQAQADIAKILAQEEEMLKNPIENQTIMVENDNSATSISTYSNEKSEDASIDAAQPSTSTYEEEAGKNVPVLSGESESSESESSGTEDS